MASNSISGVGTIFNQWINAQWVQIAEINSINGPNMKRDTIDVSSLSSTGGYREFIPSFRDSGDVKLSMNFTREGYEIMKGSFDNHLVKNYQITIPDTDNTTLEFVGYVTELPLTIPVDDKITLDVSIKISGELVLDSSNPEGFITEWTVSGDSTARTVTLPLVNTRTEGSLSYNCVINWGDGTTDSTVTAYNDANRIHTYAIDGTYQIEITGICEGWSFNNVGDKLKIRKVINWGNAAGFTGFKYLYGAFYGCTNLNSIPTGRILASGTGVLSDGFYRIFAFCNFTTIPSFDMFYDHPNVTTHAFDGVFSENNSLTGSPANMFDVHTAVTTYAFNQLFYECDAYAGIPTDFFKYNINCGIWAFNQTFRKTAVVSIPTDLFRYNTLVGAYAFRDTFQGCASLASIPTDLFRYNILISDHAFEGTFIGCTSLTTVPTDLFRYNVLVAISGFIVVFEGCSNLQTIPDDLFRYNVLCSTQGFEGAFQHCDKLQINPNVFGSDLAARFADSPVPLGFATMFDRASFTGTQGTAPALWGVAFPDIIELSTLPATIWVAGDVITGQSSGVTSTVVARFGTWKFVVKNLSGTYTDGEVIGVTGTPAKLADQSPGYPIKTDAEVITDCFNGAGNSGTSISNYASIPAPWL